MEGEESVPETAVILKGLTRQCNAEDLQSLLNQMNLAYNFLYLPWDSRHNHNIGLCFVNFVNVSAAERCVQEFTTMLSSQGDKARFVKSVKKYHVHGIGLNLAYFIASAGMRAINHEHAPLVFDELGRAISLHEAVAKYVTMDLLLKATELKDRTVHAARARPETSSHRSVGEGMRLADATQSSKVAEKSHFVARGQPAGSRCSLPRYAESEVEWRDASGAALYHQPTAWQPRQAFGQQYQLPAHQPYPVGSTITPTHPNSLSIHASQNHSLAERNFPQSRISESHPSSANHQQSYGSQAPDCACQVYQGPNAKCSLFRVGDHEFAVFDF